MSRHRLILGALVAGIAITAGAVAAGGPTDASARPAAPGCRAFDPSIQGFYRRVGAVDIWRLTVGSCTYTERNNFGGYEGSGDYTVSAGDAAGGTAVLSNDPGCTSGEIAPGGQDLPTPYDYRFDGQILTLAVQGGNEADLCPGRASALGRAWVKVPNGKVTIVYDATNARRTGGRFTMSGAGKDSGRVVLTRSANGRTATGSLVGREGTIYFTETTSGRTRVWRMTSGTELYSQTSGKGTARRTVRSGRLHVVITATVSGT
jgi:hypothetical protein